MPLADGAALTLAGLDTLGLADGSHEDQSYTQYLVKWAPGVDINAAQARLAGQYEVVNPRPPPEVQKLTQVQALPRILAGFLASIAVLAMGYALVTGVTRRRRDFAVLRTLGFTGHQVSGAVAWQASTITALGVAAGIPLGLMIGRTIWAHVAGGLGVATDSRRAYVRTCRRGAGDAPRREPDRIRSRSGRGPHPAGQHAQVRIADLLTAISTYGDRESLADNTPGRRAGCRHPRC